MERNRQVVEKKRGLKNLIWPPMNTPRKTKLVRLPALFLTVFAAFLWSVVAIAGFFSEIHNWNWTILSAILWILIALGLYKMRREAAIAGFIFSCIILVGHWGSYRVIGDVCLVILYIYAIRGTFVYKHLATA